MKRSFILFFYSRKFFEEYMWQWLYLVNEQAHNSVKTVTSQNLFFFLDFAKRTYFLYRLGCVMANWLQNTNLLILARYVCFDFPASIFFCFDDFFFTKNFSATWIILEFRIPLSQFSSICDALRHLVPFVQF